jgi:hypothetical protein
MSSEQPTSSQPPAPRRSRKRRLEAIAMAIMGLGAFMMFQPFTIVLYSYSFVVILAGTIMFIIVSHFRA